MSQRQIVPPAFFGRQIVPDDKMSHFLPMRQIVPATKCPISSLATKCPTDAPIKTIVSLAFFRRQIVPRRQNVPLSPQRQNVPTYALMHRKVVGTFCRLSHFVNLMPNTLGKICAFSEHVLDISWLHFDYILGSAGL